MTRFAQLFDLILGPIFDAIHAETGCRISFTATIAVEPAALSPEPTPAATPVAVQTATPVVEMTAAVEPIDVEPVPVVEKIAATAQTGAAAVEPKTAKPGRKRTATKPAAAPVKPKRGARAKPEPVASGPQLEPPAAKPKRDPRKKTGTAVAT